MEHWNGEGPHWEDGSNYLGFEFKSKCIVKHKEGCNIRKSEGEASQLVWDKHSGTLTVPAEMLDRKLV